MFSCRGPTKVRCTVSMNIVGKSEWRRGAYNFCRLREIREVSLQRLRIKTVGTGNRESFFPILINRFKHLVYILNRGIGCRNNCHAISEP